MSCISWKGFINCKILTEISPNTYIQLLNSTHTHPLPTHSLILLRAVASSHGAGLRVKAATRGSMVAPIPNTARIIVWTVPLWALLAVQAVPQVQTFALFVVLEPKEEILVLEMMVITHCVQERVSMSVHVSVWQLIYMYMYIIMHTMEWWSPTHRM